MRINYRENSLFQDVWFEVFLVYYIHEVKVVELLFLVFFFWLFLYVKHFPMRCVAYLISK
jgi:hypothetical protein